MEAQKSNRNGVFKVGMRQKDRNGMIKIVLQTWMPECDSNKVKSFLFTSPVCLILTDLYLSVICLLLNVHPEYIRYIKIREGTVHWVSQVHVNAQKCHGGYYLCLYHCSGDNSSTRFCFFFLSQYVCISSGLGSSPAHISVQSWCNPWPFIAVVWCIRTCLFADTCSRIGSNLVFLFAKRLD